MVDSPSGRDVRPTTSLVRKALFDILGNNIEDAVFVDLYAGTGAVAFEALSRGAQRAVAVEQDRTLLNLIRATATRFGCASARKFASGLRRSNVSVVGLKQPRTRDLGNLGGLALREEP